MSEASMLAALKMSVIKPGSSRNYEDLMTIKIYMFTIDFFKELFSSLSFLQIDELCRSLYIPNTFCDTYLMIPYIAGPFATNHSNPASLSSRSTVQGISSMLL